MEFLGQAYVNALLHIYICINQKGNPINYQDDEDWFKELYLGMEAIYLKHFYHLKFELTV